MFTMHGRKAAIWFMLVLGGLIFGAPQPLRAQEQEIENAFANAIAAANAGQPAGFMAFISADYLDNGETFADFQVDVGGFITEGGQIAYVLGPITIQGDMAAVEVTWTFTFDGQQEIDQEVLILRKEGTAWRIYGNQQRHDVWADSQHWPNGYHVSFGVEDPGQKIAGVTVTGPGIAGSLSLSSHIQNWDGEEVAVWWYDGEGPSFGTSIPSPPPTYTITVTEGTGPAAVNYIYPLQVSGWVGGFATNLSPVQQAGGPVVFTWTTTPGATRYSVELSDTNYNRLWNSYDNDSHDGDIPATRPWAIYDGGPLETGKEYIYWVAARDVPGNTSFAEGRFTYLGQTGISFAQQVTDANAASLPGVSVTLGNNPYPQPAAVTDAGGNFTLSGAPLGSWFYLEMAKIGFRPTYTVLIRSATDISGGPRPFRAYTPADTATWPVDFASRGVIAGLVTDAAGNNLAGAVVTARGLLHPEVPYTVTYRDDSDKFGGSATYANGRFYVPNVDDGDIVTVTANKGGYTFQERHYPTHGGGISQGRIVGAAQEGTITFSGSLNDAFGEPIAGAMVQVAGNPAIATVTGPDGSFALGGIPAGSLFSLTFRKEGYADSYSRPLQSAGDLGSARPFNLFTRAELDGWGIAAGRGAIIGRVVDDAEPLTSYIAGAAVSGQGAAGSYTVVYLNDDLVIVPGAASTPTNGRYLVLDVADGDNVGVTASKPGWDFQTRELTGHADSVTQSTIPGLFMPAGDIDGNWSLDLTDAILALKTVAGIQAAGLRPDYTASGANVDRDDRIGLPEVIYIIQSLAGLRGTAFPVDAAIDGVNGSLTIFRETWNAHGTNYDYLSIFHAGYLNDGLDRDQAVLDDMPPDGLVIDTYAVNSVLSYDAEGKIITVAIDYSGTFGGDFESGIDTETFIYDAASGHWLRYGNQRIGEFSVWPGKSRTMAAGGITDRFILHFHLKARKDMATQVVVNGPEGWTQTFTNRLPLWEDPDNYDGFYTATGGMDVYTTRMPQVGDVYTFTVSKTAGGTDTHTQVLQNVLAEAPTVTNPASHSLNGLAGTTLFITWTLPDPAIEMEDIRIESGFRDATGGVPGVVTSPTGGYIDIPVGGAAPGYGEASDHIDVRIHHLDEIFTNCRFEFGG